MKQIEKRNIGLTFKEDQTARLVVWAPEKESVAVHVLTKELTLDLALQENGYWLVETDQIKPGDRYRIVLNNENDYPDPASLHQPEGVHDASQAVDLDAYDWSDDQWSNPGLKDYIVYELHVGTFSESGDFDGVIEKLPYLVELGITAIEIMPVAQFPGSRNWGYDGVYPFAVQNSYGGYEGLQRLVDACHKHKLAVILDVVFNHLGPEGNYLSNFGPFFTDKYNTPWGSAVNFDDAWSDGVRRFYIDNALMWFRDFHIDALRLDAVHAIKDLGATHILEEISRCRSILEKQTGKTHYLIAESDLNDPKYIRSTDNHGYGMDAQWIDEFHHALRVTAGEKQAGYYSDFNGISHLEKAFKDTYVYDGFYSPHRKRTFGKKATGHPFSQFLIFSQNHDQVGNRMLGERTSQLVSFEMQKLMAAITIFSPYIPMLFMGEEWSAKSPFLYFVSHNDPDLVEAVRKGRKAEFKDFHASGEAPDPQSEKTFKDSSLDWGNVKKGEHEIMLNYYKELIRLRKKHLSTLQAGREHLEVHSDEERQTLCLTYTTKEEKMICCLNFSKEVQEIKLPNKDIRWFSTLNSANPKWNGPEEMPESALGGLLVNLLPESIIIYTDQYV